MTRRERILLGVLGASIVLLVGVKGKGWMDTATNLVKRWEGLKLDVYQDVAGLWTIGYGHLVKPGERFHPHGPVKRITEQEASQLLEQDMAQARVAVNAGVKVPVTDKQRGALVSLVFNIGSGAFASSTLLRKLNGGDTLGAADEFLRWNRAGGQVVQGLVNRRKHEREVFLS